MTTRQKLIKEWLGNVICTIDSDEDKYILATVLAEFYLDLSEVIEALETEEPERGM